MITDTVWQQFLFFCHRNGLYYGDQPDDISLFHWKNDASMKMVRSLKNVNLTTTMDTKHATCTDTTNDETTEDQPLPVANLIAVSSLERHLRK
jgi:hypothetical protein